MNRYERVQIWMKECKKILVRNDEAKALGSRIQISSRQPKNLMRIAAGHKDGKGVRKIPNDENPGCFKCNHCRVSCPILNETKIFKSTNTGKIYKIRQHIDCDSDWLIFLCTCKKCKGQYVGKLTTPFKLRHTNYKQEIKKNVEGSGPSLWKKWQMWVQGLVYNIDRKGVWKTLRFLADRELWWQQQLRVFVENGGKAHWYRKEFV